MNAKHLKEYGQFLLALNHQAAEHFEKLIKTTRQETQYYHHYNREAGAWGHAFDDECQFCQVTALAEKLQALTVTEKDISRL